MTSDLKCILVYGLNWEKKGFKSVNNCKKQKQKKKTHKGFIDSAFNEKITV